MANETALADQLRTTRFGHNARSWVWDYARKLGKSLSQVGPSDLRVSFNGYGEQPALELSCTMRSVQEAEAIREIIWQIGHGWLSASREMTHGDLYWTPPPPPETYSEGVSRLIGESTG